MAPPRVLGDERALALAGLPEPAGHGPTIHLGPTDEPVDVVWLAGAHDGAAAGASAVIATSGDGLWSRTVWPARDDLFGMPPPAAPHGLIVCSDRERLAQVTDKLAARGMPHSGAPELTAEGLASASVVALLGAADAGTPDAPWAASAMPAEAPAVLAARRVLIAPRCATAFGLLPGTDHLAFGTADDVVQYADAVLTFPRSFEPLTALGALTAERHRASVVYQRLADELRSAPRSSAPAG